MSRRKTIKPIDLTATVDKLLAEYGDEIFDVLGDAIKETSVRARDELRSVNHFSDNGNPTGAYSRSWEYEQRMVGRYKEEATVYNENHYRLTHLLESGHAKWLWGHNGEGRVEGFEHIKPVNDNAQDTLVELVTERIERL